MVAVRQWQTWQFAGPPSLPGLFQAWPGVAARPSLLESQLTTPWPCLLVQYRVVLQQCTYIDHSCLLGLLVPPLGAGVFSAVATVASPLGTRKAYFLQASVMKASLRWAISRRHYCLFSYTPFLICLLGIVGATGRKHLSEDSSREGGNKI